MSAGYLLDTNVLSELMREVPAPEVLAWFASQTANDLHTSVITEAEILAGIAFLPAGKRRDGLALAAHDIFEQDFQGRCIAFDCRAASHYALLRAQRQQEGKPIATADAQIAAIALAYGLRLATRNVKDFVGVEGLTVVDPWRSH